MPTTRRKKTRTRSGSLAGLHPNLAAWLKDEWPLPIPEEALEIMIDPSPPDQYIRLWAQHRPGEPFLEPWRWYIRKEAEDGKAST